MRHGDALRQSVQRLREERYPDLPVELVDKILDIEERNVDEREEAVAEVTRAIHDEVKRTTPESSSTS